MNKGFNPFNPFPTNQNLDKELIKEKNKKPKITEITLPIEKLTGRNKIVNPDLPTTTDVPYATSINLENEYMKKTPKIHGIKL